MQHEYIRQAVQRLVPLAPAAAIEVKLLPGRLDAQLDAAVGYVLILEREGSAAGALPLRVPACVG